MTGDELKNLLQKYVDAMNSHDIDRLMDCYSDDVVRVDALTGTLEGKSALKSFYSSLFSAFPDMCYAIENVLAGGDLVATEASMSGTHKGPFPPFEDFGATGKKVCLSGAIFYDLKDGKFAMERVYSDYGSLVEQLGISGEQPRAA